VPKILSHAFATSLEVRAADDDTSDGRTLIGLAVPFGVELEVSDWWDDYTEVFRKGAFAKTLRERTRPVPLLAHHAHRALPIGRSTSLVETDDGLEAAFHLTAGVDEADRVLALVLDDALSGLSIGFEPVQERVTRGSERVPPSDLELVERTEVRLREVSVCNFPAFETAQIAGVRDSQSRHPTGLATLEAERTRLRMVRDGAIDRYGRVRRTG
jgi:HK97 family phage prohead protease